LTTQFFSKRQGAAVLKHGILKRYLPVFVSMTGSRSGKVAYLDCYAGPGQYEDGTDGSPAVALATAKAVAGMRGNASLVLHLIEQDASSYEQLCAFLERHDVDWVVDRGSAHELVPAILEEIPPRAPLFAFVDPFGLPIPFETLAAVMRRGRAPGRLGAATEVLLNFSTIGINRSAGQLDAKVTREANAKASRSVVKRVDDTLGGAWWQPIWRSGSTDRVARIRDEYADRLMAAAGGNWFVFDISVSDRWLGPESYRLLLFTQHTDGIWRFHEALSSAQEEYRQYCHESEGRLELEPLDRRESDWIKHIEQNVEHILSRKPSFTPVDEIVDVYGDAFGFAREKHLRKALQSLYKASRISTTPKGNLDRLRIQR
jgi:three-Cys-motif partner protein